MNKVYDYYVAPEEYARAAKLNIDGQTVDRRIRELGWTKQRAITTPIRKRDSSRSRWRKLAQQNGISVSAFYSRVNRGWPIEKAATTPTQSEAEIKDQALRMVDVIRKYPPEYVDLAASNGIAYHTFINRLKLGWSMDDAATKPVMSNVDIGKKGAAALRKREGDWNALIFGKR